MEIGFVIHADTPDELREVLHKEFTRRLNNVKEGEKVQRTRWYTSRLKGEIYSLEGIVALLNVVKIEPKKQEPRNAKD